MQQANSPNSPLKLYKFCPKCGGDFKFLGENYLKCQQCSHSYFVNQAPTAGFTVLNERNEVMLAKRKFEPKKGTWQCLGGFVGLDESFEDALAREAREELGVEIEVKGYLGSFPEVYEYGGIAAPFIGPVFIATISSGTPTPADDVDEIRYFSVEELPELDITYPALRTLLVDYLKALRL